VLAYALQELLTVKSDDMTGQRARLRNRQGSEPARAGYPPSRSRC